MKPSTHALAAMLLALLPMSLPAVAADDPAVDRIIVKWRATTDDMPTLQRHARELAVRLGNPFTQGRNIGGRMSVLQLATAQRGRQLQSTLAALRADPGVEIAEPDQHVRVLFAPSDPLFSGTFAYAGNSYEYQWYLKGAQPAAIRADAAWDITHGGASAATSPVVIAVVDTGVRPNHEDLAGKLLPGFDFVSDNPSDPISNDGDGWDADPTDPGDYITADDLASGPFADRALKCGGGDNYDQPVNSTWHGTRVAGLIGASTDNGIGMAGAGFNIRIVPVRVLGKCGGALSDVLAGMYWAAGFFDSASGHPIPAPVLTDPAALRNHPNLHPAQVINLSLGAAGTCSDLYAIAVRDITALGVLIVAAAGNDGSGVDQPADCPGVLAVAGIRHTGTKVGYSNLGPEVGIAAPAGNCVQTNAGDPCLFALNTITNQGAQMPGQDAYSTPLAQPSFGTSFSSPLVAATAGLMKTVNPGLTPALLTARLKLAARAFPSSDDLGTTQACVLPSINAAQSTPCICNAQVCGAGMLDAAGAVQQALRPVAIANATHSGNRFTLDGSGSFAATGDNRSIATYAWSVQSVSGGASMPTISNASQPSASIPAPADGSVALQLTITDNLGGSDTTSVTVNATDGGGGGGGSFGIALLALLALLLAARHAQRRTSSFPQLR